MACACDVEILYLGVMAECTWKTEPPFCHSDVVDIKTFKRRMKAVNFINY
jgi:hypothetical protein